MKIFILSVLFTLVISISFSQITQPTTLGLPDKRNSNSSLNLVNTVSITSFGVVPSPYLTSDDPIYLMKKDFKTAQYLINFNNVGLDAAMSAINDTAYQVISIYFPAGNYIFSKPFKIKKGINIYGEGKNNTVIQFYNCNGIVFDNGLNHTCICNVKGDEEWNLDKKFIIRDLNIRGDANIDNNTESYAGITINSGRLGGDILNVQLQGFGTGIAFNNKSWDSRIDNVDILYNIDSNRLPHKPYVDVGIKLSGQCVNDIISNCHINAVTIGIEAKDLISCPCDPNKPNERTEGLQINNSIIASDKVGIYAVGALSLNVNNNVIDQNSNYGVIIKRCRSVLVSNNWISSKDSIKFQDQALAIEGSTDCHFSNNLIQSETPNSRTVGITNFVADWGTSYNSNNITFTGNTIAKAEYTGNNLFIETGSKNISVIGNSFTRFTLKDRSGWNSYWQKVQNSTKFPAPYIINNGTNTYPTPFLKSSSNRNINPLLLNNTFDYKLPQF